MESNQPILHPVLLRQIISSLMQMDHIPNGENDILNESFNDHKDIVKPLDHTFKEKLETYIVTEKDNTDKLSCAICQETFALNENIIKLPCSVKPHFFHKENTEECNGILPWFEEHNTCPVCREQYPSEPEPEPEPEPDRQLPESLIPTSDVILTPEQIASLNMIEGNIDRLTHPTIEEIDNTIVNEITNVIHTLLTVEGETVEGENHVGIRQIMMPSMLLNEMMRQTEEEELQGAIIRSMSER